MKGVEGSLDETEIINLLNERSEQAIHEMDEAYGRLCRKIAGNILSSPEDVEEVLSDTMLAAWDQIPPEQPKSLAAYLSRITRNLSLVKLRGNSAAMRNERLKVSISELEECIPAPDTPQDSLEYGLLTQAVNAYLSAVPAINRFIFIRRHYYMDSCKEIAKLAGLSEQAVRTRLLRLRAGLKDYLEKEEIIE